MHSSERRVFESLRRVVAALTDTARSVERAAGITPAQRFVLQLLAEAPAPTINALAELTHTSQATVSILVKRLVARKLVTRNPDSADRRRSLVALTAAGRRLVMRTDVPVQVRLSRALADMSRRDVAALASGLETWVKRAGLAGTPASLFLETPSARRRGNA